MQNMTMQRKRKNRNSNTCEVLKDNDDDEKYEDKIGLETEISKSIEENKRNKKNERKRNKIEKDEINNVEKCIL